MAMGRGRHALVLARAGFLTFGVDVNLGAIEEARARARAEGLAVLGWCADLTTIPLPADVFDLLLVTRYLQRDLFSSIRHSVRPGGFVLYETFTDRPRRLDRTRPTSPAHLLQPGELRAHFAHWEVLFSEEDVAPDALARIVARRPRNLAAG